MAQGFKEEGVGFASTAPSRAAVDRDVCAGAQERGLGAGLGAYLQSGGIHAVFFLWSETPA